ncbi:unnamed protein product [Paramecium sonneborni]|uniref:Uncharacterized protein n=1 Tax=Paramecium sonneborni TaxID=65129 RepID=A0A8S1RNP4_9CILI|nr:unnamed protein product [Paramecium sonneborni]
MIHKYQLVYFRFRLCFIDNNQYTFQSLANKQIHLYEMNCGNRQFVKTKEILIYSGSNDSWGFFSQQYIKLKFLLVNKWENINLISKKKKESLQRNKVINQIIIIFMDH